MSEEVVCKKKQLEEKIEKLAQEFFAADKADTSLARKRDRLKTQLWATMYEYYKLVYHAFINPNNKKSNGIIDIITDTSLRCLENYKVEFKKPFLHYANAAMKKEIKYKKTKAQVEISDSITDINGKEISIFDFMESNLNNPHNDFEIKETCISTFKTIDHCFAKKQERVKPYVSVLLTVHFFDNLFALQELGVQSDFSFIDRKLFFEYLQLAQKKQPLPTQQDVAKRFGKDKTDASRALKKFFVEIQKEIQKNCQL